MDVDSGLPASSFTIMPAVIVNVALSVVSGVVVVTLPVVGSMGTFVVTGGWYAPPPPPLPIPAGVGVGVGVGIKSTLFGL